jgi:hypothetical protein
MMAKSFGFKTIDVRFLDLILEFIRFIIGLSRNLVHMKRAGNESPPSLYLLTKNYAV